MISSTRLDRDQEQIAGDELIPGPRAAVPQPQHIDKGRLAVGVPLSGNSSDLLALGAALDSADTSSRAHAKPFIPIDAVPAHPSCCALKRGFDVAFAAAALLVCLPLLVACALAIRLSSEGPVMFSQVRAGRAGRNFAIAKFRTMRVDAEAVLTEYLECNPEAKREWAKHQKLRLDPRITWVGAFMRKFSLDELPQLWNVIKGEMSIVGPRPIPLYEIPVYGDGYQHYCRVRPGLTGLWQVSGRSNTGYAHRIELDQSYIQTWSMKQDCLILLRTLPAVLYSAGAY